MKEEKDIQNVYALNVKDEVVFIADVISGKKGYYCQGCKREMQAVKPIKKNIRYYFRHDVNTVPGAKKCTYTDETYRHKLAKEILQIIKKIKVPAVYKYPPKGIEGSPMLISDPKFIEAYSVGIEKYFYEDQNGNILLENKADIDEKFLLIKPDVTFFDKNKNPILFIELVATHKVTDEKKIRIKRLGIDTVQVSIPKDSPKAISQTFDNTERTKWIFNYEQENTEYIRIPQSHSEGIQFVDEIQKRFFEESPKCRSAQIRNLIYSIERCLESEQFTEFKRNLKSEISRVEKNTEKNQNEWNQIRDQRRTEIFGKYERTIKDIETKRNRIEQEESKFQEYSQDLDSRYFRKREDFERSQREIEREIDSRSKTDYKIGDTIIRAEDTIRYIIREREEIESKDQNFERDREQLNARFEHDKRRESESFIRIEARERESIRAIREIIERETEKIRNEETVISEQFEQEERTIIGAISDRSQQFIRGLKEGKFEEFEFDRSITGKINEFNEAMSILENISSIYKHRERIRNAIESIKSGAYKNWNNKGEVF